jgi:prepilin-type N-terminal cleavage/methylation domain-containing protein
VKPLVTKGFTLVELVTSLAVIGLVGSLALNAFNYAQKSYNDDKTSNEDGSNITAGIDLVGNNIKQAGEGINDPKFPVLELQQNGDSSILTTRRNLGDESLPICQNIVSGTSTTSIIMRSTTFSGACSDTAMDGSTPPLPLNLSKWKEKRCQQDGKDGCQGNNEEKFTIALYDGNGNIQLAKYIGETSVGTSPAIQIEFIAPATSFNRNFNGGQSFMYLIEQKRYSLDPSSKTLRLSVDGGNSQALISNVDKFKIAVKPKGTSTVLETFPTSSKNWQDIEDVSLDLDVKGQNSKKAKETKNKFYPRNALSGKSRKNNN